MCVEFVFCLCIWVNDLRCLSFFVVFLLCRVIYVFMVVIVV